MIVRIFLVGMFLWASSGSKLLACRSCLSGLASPKGVAIVAVIYGVTSGISDFVGGFRWNKHIGVSDETNAQLQEWGGITAAIENWILGFMIPLMIYLYTRDSPVAIDQGRMLEDV